MYEFNLGVQLWMVRPIVVNQSLIPKRLPCILAVNGIQPRRSTLVQSSIGTLCFRLMVVLFQLEGTRRVSGGCVLIFWVCCVFFFWVRHVLFGDDRIFFQRVAYGQRSIQWISN